MNDRRFAPWDRVLLAAGVLLLVGLLAAKEAYAQAGDPPAAPAAQLAATELLADIQAITANGHHTCALTSGGGVKCWGSNYSGELGDGTMDNHRPAAMDVLGLDSGVQAVAAGDVHTCALTTSGVKCWGRNNYGQLGDGTTEPRTTPVDVLGLGSGVQTVAAGGAHTCALTTGGGVKCWGSNNYGQLGDGTTDTRTAPVDVLGLSSGVQAIAAGDQHTCALTSGGGVKCWGYNWSGRLGDGTTTTRLTPVDVLGLSSGVQMVAAGGEHTCALTTDGGVKCWGDNYLGQLGDGTKIDRLSPVDVNGLSSGVQAIVASYMHTCALTTAGGVKCWSWNGFGQLGDGTTIDRPTPVDVLGLSSGVQMVAVGDIHTCALTTSGGVKCWGNRGDGQLGDGIPGNGVDGGDYLRPVDVSGLSSGVQANAAGGSHSCALTTEGGVRCWGRNNDGQLGDDTTVDHPTAVDVSGFSNGAQAVTVGGAHTCALTTGGGVKCWGRNNAGQLGNNSTDTRLTPVDVLGLGSGVQAVAAGGAHTCALTTGGGVKCWGDNEYGQLGDDTPELRLTPVDVLGLDSGVQAVAAGGAHTCALAAGGGVKCWGSNTYGQLGDGTTEARLTPVDVLGLGSDVQAVAAGGDYTCALTTGGGVKCWGRNNHSQLGDGTRDTHLTPADVLGLSSGVQAITAGGAHTCALTTGGGVKCWGDNGFGQLGDGTVGNHRPVAVDVFGLSSGVQAVAAGGAHTCALTTAGGVKCWGWNIYGQLGVNPGWTPVDVIEAEAAQITSTSVTTATVGQPYTYTVTATGVPIPTFSLVVAPQGMAIDPTNGVIQWTPAETGDFMVTVQTENGVQPPAQQSFTITVSPIPQAPEITSPLITTATVNQPYTCTVTATGAPTSTFSLVTAPEGMTIDPASGVIQWTPSAAGDYPVTVQAENGVDPVAQQSFTVTVLDQPVEGVNLYLPLINQ